MQFEDVSNQLRANLSIDEFEDADMSGNPVRARSDSGAPLLHELPAREGDGGERVALAAIDPDGGYQRTCSEELVKSHMILPGLGQL